MSHTVLNYVMLLDFFREYLLEMLATFALFFGTIIAKWTHKWYLSRASVKILKNNRLMRDLFSELTVLRKHLGSLRVLIVRYDFHPNPSNIKNRVTSSIEFEEHADETPEIYNDWQEAILTDQLRTDVDAAIIKGCHYIKDTKALPDSAIYELFNVKSIYYSLLYSNSKYIWVLTSAWDEEREVTPVDEAAIKLSNAKIRNILLKL